MNPRLQTLPITPRSSPLLQLPQHPSHRLPTAPETLLRHGHEPHQPSAGGDPQRRLEVRLHEEEVSLVCHGLDLRWESVQGEGVGGLEGTGEEEACAVLEGDGDGCRGSVVAF